MADKIFLQDDEICTKNIKKAVSLLETVTRSSDSLFAATSLYDIASTMQHNVRNSYGVRFLSNAAEEAESIACELEAVAANLASLQKRLTDCPEALQEADKTFKGWNDKSGEHWLSRTFSTLFGTTIGWYLCDLFGIPRNAPVETVVSSGDETHEQTVPQKGKPEDPNGSEATNISGSIQLSPNMENYSLRQGDYAAFEYPYGYNAGCCALAYAIGLSIVTGKAYDPTKFWHDGASGYHTYYDEEHRSEWMAYDASQIYAELKSGNPTQLAYIYESSPANQKDADHFVLITGVREGADIDNLQLSDFIAIDPASGTEKPLTDCWKFNPERITGGFTIK